MRPRLAVLMPAFNVAAYVAEAARSILWQTHGDFLFLVLDDGSTDGTYDALVRACAEDTRVRLFRVEHNMGVVWARNFLLDRAAAEGADVIVWQDADDASHPFRLARQVQNWNGGIGMKRDDVLGCVAAAINEDGSAVWPVTYSSAPKDRRDTHAMIRSFGAPPLFATSFMRLESVRAVGGFRTEKEAGHGSEDADLILRIFDGGGNVRSLGWPPLYFARVGRPGRLTPTIDYGRVLTEINRQHRREGCEFCLEAQGESTAGS